MNAARLSILLVEDEPDIRAVMAMALGRDPSITLAMFADAPEALQHLDVDDAARFDVALINIHLPTISGVRLAERLWSRPDTADIPVIFVTAAVAPKDHHLYTDIGATGVLSKPFDPIALPDQVRAMLAGSTTPPPSRSR